MIRVLRRMGIAIGSLVIATLVVGLVGGIVLPLFGIPLTPTPSISFAASGGIETVIAIVLGGLIDRDIVRRDSG